MPFDISTQNSPPVVELQNQPVGELQTQPVVNLKWRETSAQDLLQNRISVMEIDILGLTFLLTRL